MKHIQSAPPERWQHGQGFIRDISGVQAVREPVRDLRRVGLIDDADVATAERFVADSIRASGHAQRGGEASLHGDIVGYYAAVWGLTWFQNRLAHAVLVDRYNPDYLARLSDGKISTKAMIYNVILTLKRLTAAYAAYDRRAGK